MADTTVDRVLCGAVGCPRAFTPPTHLETKAGVERPRPFLLHVNFTGPPADEHSTAQSVVSLLCYYQWEACLRRKAALYKAEPVMRVKEPRHRPYVSTGRARGRPRGFTPEQIVEMREMRSRGLKLRVIAERFHCTLSHVGLIARRRIYEEIL